MSDKESRGNLVTQAPEPDRPLPVPVHPCNVFADPDGAGVAWTSLDPLDPKHLFVMSELGNESGTTIDSWIGKVFDAQNAYINRWNTTDTETGEYVDGIRVTLISPRGQFLSFTGQSAIRCLQRLCANPAIGMPPWAHCLNLKVSQVTEGKRRRHVLSLEPAEVNRLISEYQAKQAKKK
jgi:hypothetical protein